MPLVCALCLQDAKAHQLKELQCEAAVLEVYTGLYKMTELMQDSRAEVYIGTVGEPSMRAPLACFCLAGGGFCQWSLCTCEASLMAPCCRKPAGLADLGALIASCGMAAGGALGRGLACRTIESCPAVSAMCSRWTRPSLPFGKLYALWQIVCSVLHEAVKPCCPQALARPARHGILGLQQQVGSQPAHPSHCYV